MESLLQEIDNEDDAHREIYKEFIGLILGDSSIVESWSNLSTYTKLDYHSIETLAWQLSLQLHALEKRGFTLFFWKVNDILIINNGQGFLLANLEQMVPLYSKDTSHLFLSYPTIYPLPKAVCAPELLQMAALPFITHRSASYYSLALLSLSLLTKCNLSLEKIQGTKLFYFLERCLKKEPKERMCLFV